ncbi:MAG: dockerin-like protein [Myxococcota bacterium]
MEQPALFRELTPMCVKLSSKGYVLVCLNALVLAACSAQNGDPSQNTGGKPGNGGASGHSGGNTSISGSPGAGGTSAGGLTGSGGSTGGTASGGASNQGGSSSAMGGSAAGGSNSGGAGSSSGGSANSGGSTGSGGSAQGGTAGMTAAGGNTGSTGGGMCGKESCATGCTAPNLPAFSALTSNEKLPDPFKTSSGTRISSKSEWPCRRAEVAAQLQKYETGSKNPKEPGTVTGSVSGSTFTVNVLGKSFTVSIKLPSGNGPFPAVVYLDSFSLPGNWNNVAQIKFDTNSMGSQNGGRGQGFFFSTTGSNDGAGALIAWSWGVSRLIDALEATPAAKIDPKRIAITGCSRNGKGALMIGAFDERIALTIPQESGSGGSAAWRVSYAEDASFGGTMSSHKVQTLDSAYGEQPWFGTALQQFSGASNTNKLPFDHHQLLGMVAPRGLLILENTDYQWLGVNSVATSSTAAQMIFEGLGVLDNIGFSNSSHSHCSPNSAEAPYVDAFVQKFLFGKTETATKVWKISKTAFGSSSATIDKAKWIDWTVPALN